jgi:hypothetical protein
MAEFDPAVVLEDVLDRARAIGAIANDDEHWQVPLPRPGRRAGASGPDFRRL